jgi:hypothetical protein
MFLAMLLSASVCSPPALPPPAERTPAFWDRFLNGVLHDCYGRWNPMVRDTSVSISPTASMTGATFAFRIEGAKTDVFIEPALVEWAPTGDHLAAILGHEAVHIAIFESLGINPMPTIQEEIVADTIAATSVRHGACRLVEMYEWNLARLAPKGDRALEQRTAILKPLCVAQQALK